MKRARVEISYEMLEQLLQLPAHVKIAYLIPEDRRYHYPRSCEMVIEGPELPVDEVSEGMIIPSIGVRMSQDDTGATVPKWHVRFEGL